MTRQTNSSGNTRPSRSIKEFVRRPEFTTDVVQIVKSVIATTVAWWISISLLESDLPFLAPWTALLTVHATVHRSWSRGIQTTIASTMGVGLSFVIGFFLGVNIWTFALALLVAIAASRISSIREEGIAIATTVIFVLGNNFDEQTALLDNRILELVVGVATGVVINALVLPPVRDTQAARYVDSVNRRMGEVLIDMAEEFSDSWDTDKADAWFEETASISREVDSAWVTVRFARESRQGNPRNRLRFARQARARTQDNAQTEKASYEDILARTDEGVSHLRHLARTLREASDSSEHWDQRFRRRWVNVVTEVGRAIAEPDANVGSYMDELNSMSADMVADESVSREYWPIYGSMITSLRHIVVVVDDVASAREAREGTRENPRASK